MQTEKVKSQKEKDIDMGAIISIYGSYEAWQASQYREMKRRPERIFLKTIRTMLQVRTVERCIRLYPQRLDILNQDKELMAYFDSVHRAGEDAWKDEESRVRQKTQEMFPKPPIPAHQIKKATFDGAGNLSLEAIKALLPTWRSWGRLLLSYGL